MPHLLKGGFSEQASTGVDVYQIRQPLGVVAGITPFNFPAMVPMWMFGNAIACGNTFILKPSEKDPSASMFIAELLREAGVPEGVFNVVQGDKVAVDAILEHPDIAAVSFVGSTPIARYIYETGTRNGKRVQALGGAKNHMLVLPDADVEMAADAAVSAGYGSSGERCMAIATVVAVGDVADPARRGDRRAAAEDQGRSGLRPEGRDGPAGHAAAPRQGGLVPRQRDEAGRDGGRGRPRASAVSRLDGYFLGACLIDNVEPGMDAYRDEIFGPVLTVVRVGSYEEALQLINDNPYGNGTAIFTRDGGAARQFQFDVNVGHGRHQRAGPGAGRLLQLRRLEVVPVRRPQHVRARGDPVLHAQQGRDLALAGPGDLVRRPRVPADPLTRGRRIGRPNRPARGAVPPPGTGGAEVRP